MFIKDEVSKTENIFIYYIYKHTYINNNKNFFF